MKLLKANIDSFLAALVGISLICLLTQHSGLGISPDSIYYTSTADSFLKGSGFYQFDGKPFVMFPVGYPIVLSLLKLLFGAHFFQIIPYFNALLFGATIFMVGVMVEESKVTYIVKWILLAIIAISPSLMEVYTMLWSETLFITEVVLFIYFGRKYFEKYQLGALVLIAILAALAAETRLAGVTVIATGCFLIVASNRLSWGTKTKHLLIFGILASSLFMINLIRNALLTQTLTGNRQKGVTPLLENIKYYGLVISDWLPFSKYSHTFPLLIGFAFIVILLVVFVLKLTTAKNKYYENAAVAFSLIYSVFMLTVATVSRFETINNRLLAPLYIPCILALGFYLNGLFEWVKNKSTLHGLRFLLFVVVVGTLVQYSQSYTVTYKENKEGGIGGYSDDDWLLNSGLLNYLSQHPSFFNTNEKIYSNAAHAVYFKTAQQVQILPERKYIHLVQDFNQMSSQLLIWFHNEDNPEVLTLQEVAVHKNLQIIGKFNDGVIYHCTSK